MPAARERKARSVSCWWIQRSFGFIMLADVASMFIQSSHVIPWYENPLFVWHRNFISTLQSQICHMTHISFSIIMGRWLGNRKNTQVAGPNKSLKHKSSFSLKRAISERRRRRHRHRGGLGVGRGLDDEGYKLQQAIRQLLVGYLHKLRTSKKILFFYRASEYWRVILI